MSKRRTKPATVRCFHYTGADEAHLGSILKVGELWLTESNLDFTPGNDHAGPDVVWLLDSPFRPGDSHGLANPQHPNRDLKTHVKIEVELPRDEVMSWFEYADRYAMTEDNRRIMMRSGGGYANAARWRVIERKVLRDEWRRITYTPLGVDIPVDAELIPEDVAADFWQQMFPGAVVG